MNYNACLNCVHCDPSRTNDIGEVRCIRFSVFIKPSDNCDFYITKERQELIEQLRGKEI